MRQVLAHREGRDLATLCLEFLRAESPGAQELGALLFSSAYPYAPTELRSALVAAAQSEHWEVREWAAGALGEALSAHLGDLWPVVREWTKSPSDRLRRAAVLALMEFGRVCPPEDIGKVLDILGDMLGDPSPYVQRNLAPFAIGSALARRDGAIVAAKLREWVRRQDDLARTQVALVFTAKPGARLAPHLADVLDVLASDPSPRVQRALRKARRTIASVNDST